LIAAAAEWQASDRLSSTFAAETEPNALPVDHALDLLASLVDSIKAPPDGLRSVEGLSVDLRFMVKARQRCHAHVQTGCQVSPGKIVCTLCQAVC
jgi:hypothetical protein